MAEVAERRRRRARIATGASIVAGSAVFAPAAGAANFTVDTLADPGNGDTCAATDCSLREAITDADANGEADTISFGSGLTGEITLGAPLSVTSPDGLTIQGPGLSVVSISGDTNTDDTAGAGDTDILRVANNADVAISGLTLTEGYDGSSSKYAGGIMMQPGSTVSVTDSALTDNSGSQAGAIVNYGGDLSVQSTEISGNSASNFSGGGIFSFGQKYGTPAPTPIVAKTKILNSEITGNSAPFGGGVSSIGGKYLGSSPHADPNAENGQLAIANTTISGNSSNAGSGVLAKYGISQIAGSHLDGNTGTGAAGLLLAGGVANVTSTTISGNDTTGTTSTAPTALGVNKYAGLQLTDSTVSGNTGTGVGAVGIYLETGSNYSLYDNPIGRPVEITRSTIAGNSSTTYEAGLTIGGVPADGSVRMRSSTVSGNTGGTDSIGGGVSLYGYLDGDVLVSNSTIAGNSAAYGGGIALQAPYATAPASQVLGGGVPKIENSTIAGNTATTAGGGIYLGGYSSDGSTTGTPSKAGTLPISSTIVAGNKVGAAANDLAAATVDQPGSFKLGNSLVQTPGSAPVTQDPAGSNLLGIDPQLGALADNGGPTKTLLPAASSPVLNKGTANGLTEDQRGLARSVDGGTDIGSVEVGHVTPPDNTGPVITINKKPKSKLGTRKSRRRVRIGFQSNEPGSTFEYSLNGGEYKPLERPFARMLKAGPGKGSKYVIQIRGTDQAGNTGDPAKVKVRVIRKG